MMLQDLRRELSIWISGLTGTLDQPRHDGAALARTGQQGLKQALLAGLVVIAACARLYLLASKSVWLDEAFSITISQHPLLEMLGLIVRTDTHPPLYYLLLKLWLILGDGELQVRMLSAMFGVASIPLMYLAAAEIFEDRRAGLIAATILAFSPFHIWYGQEARMYTMLIFFVLASAYFFFRGLHTGLRRYWIGYIISTALALYTDNGAIWYVVALNIFFLISLARYKDRLKGWFFSSLAIALLYLPWLPYFWIQMRQVTGDFWLPPPSFQTVLKTFIDFFSMNFPITELSLLYLAVIFVFAFILPRRPWQLTLGALLLFVPLAISLLFSLRQPIFLSRNLIAASLGFYLLAAGTIAQFRGPKAMLALLLPLIFMNSVSAIHNAWDEPKEDWRTVASFMAHETRGKRGGLAIFLPGYAELPFDYYFWKYDRSLQTQGYPGDEVLLHPRPQQADDLGALLDGKPYIWLIVRDIESADPDWTVKAWLDTHGYVRQQDLVRDSLTVLPYYRWDKAPAGDPRRRAGAGSTAFLPMIQRSRGFQTYTVRPGETLLEIALRFDTTVQVLMDANGLESPLSIAAGEQLLVPVAGESRRDSKPGQP